MKLTYILIALLFVTLVGTAIGATIINKSLTIDSKLFDWASGDAKASLYQFAYTEKEMSDGSINVCVYKVDMTKPKFLQRINIGCEGIADMKFAEETEKAIVERFLARQKAISEYVAPSINKETTGDLTLTK